MFEQVERELLIRDRWRFLSHGLLLYSTNLYSLDLGYNGLSKSIKHFILQTDLTNYYIQYFLKLSNICSIFTNILGHKMQGS